MRHIQTRTKKRLNKMVKPGFTVKQDFKYLSIKKLYELIKEGIYN